jgi:hypothetical protein
VPCQAQFLESGLQVQLLVGFTSPWDRTW